MTLPARIAMKSRGTVVGHAPAREVGSLLRVIGHFPLFIRGQRDVQYCENRAATVLQSSASIRSKELPAGFRTNRGYPSLLNENAH